VLGHGPPEERGENDLLCPPALGGGAFRDQTNQGVTAPTVGDDGRLGIDEQW